MKNVPILQNEEEQMMEKSDIIWALSMILMPAAIVAVPLVLYLCTM